MIICTKTQRVVDWLFRIVAAVILLQTLFFKFTSAAESIYIFSQVGMEPWGRYGSGVAELIAAGLLLTPRFAWAGALLTLGVISGAIISHLTILGIVVMDDGGLLFALAIIVFTACSVTAFLHRRQIPVVGQLLKPQPA
jgi:putative oxidoreductase